MKNNKISDHAVQATFTSVGSTGDTAWPRCAHKHILQLLVGFGTKSGCSDELALNVLEKAPQEIGSDHTPADFVPNLVEKYNDLSQVSLLRREINHHIFDRTGH
jgi:hypothetical protein